MAGDQQIQIRRHGRHRVSAGAAEYFTGSVQVEFLQEAPVPTRVSIARVTFEPSARTAWHTHPLGQTLIVAEGVGRVQQLRFGYLLGSPPGEARCMNARSPLPKLPARRCPFREATGLFLKPSGMAFGESAVHKF